MILRTDAIVLRSMRYGESSRIATLFTRERGKMSVIARGARRTKSRFGSALLPMSYTEVVVYCKPNRSLQTLTETNHILRFPHLAKDLPKIAIGLRMMELVDAVLQEEQRSPGMFNLSVDTLQRLNHSTRNVANLLPFFELRMAAELGFSPLMDRAALEAVSDDGGYLALDSGAISPERPATHAMAASRSALRAFAVLAAAEVETVQRMRIEDQTGSEVAMLIESFMKFHLEESYPGRTKKVLAQMTL